VGTSAGAADRRGSMKKIVLIGDSIFDNAAYVERGQSVTDHLKRMLPADAEPVLLAVDGDKTAQTVSQLRSMPPDPAYVFVSTGGNDALEAKHWVFDLPAAEGLGDAEGLADAAVLRVLTGHVLEFRREYARLLDALSRLRVPTAVCTIYSAVPGLEDVHLTALSAYNDVIVQEAAARHFPVVDLRRVCTEHEDYADVSPIEPSAQGARKIADRIAFVFRDCPSFVEHTVIY